MIPVSKFIQYGTQDSERPAHLPKNRRTIGDFCFVLPEAVFSAKNNSNVNISK
jgi:hypothetical protein